MTYIVAGILLRVMTRWLFLKVSYRHFDGELHPDPTPHLRWWSLSLILHGSVCDSDVMCLCTSERGGVVLSEEANECLLNCEEKDISFPGRKRNTNVSSEFLEFLPQGKLREECIKQSHKKGEDNSQVISNVRSHSRPEKKIKTQWWEIFLDWS